MIKGLIFDFDGLILDTEIPIFSSWREIFTEHGCELTVADWSDYLGRSPDSFDPCDKLEACLGRTVDRAVLHARQRAREAEMITHEAPLPGVTDYIRDAKQLGLRLAIASSSPRSWVHGHLARLGLRDVFDCIRCGDEVEQAKPAPDLFLAALDCLRLRPPDAIVFEDAPHGVAAAHKAGIFCVAVPNDLTRTLSFDHADMQLSSLQELPLRDLITRVDRNRGETAFPVRPTAP